jgi:hypothetical protein
MAKSWSIGVPGHDHDAFLRVQRWLRFVVLGSFSLQTNCIVVKKINL